MIEVIEKSVRFSAVGPYRARIYVDGIDRQKSFELTNALRSRGMTTGLVKPRTDENEILIRLADMWAGCVRSSLLGEADAGETLNRAKRTGYLRDVKT